MTRERLQNATVKELRDLAKEFDIVGRWDMNKAELINAIINMCAEAPAPEQIEKATKGTDEYIERMEIGTIVAFRAGDNVLSGKYDGKLVNGRYVIITKRGAVIQVEKQNIIWVKTGTRWPKWVFELFHRNNVRSDENAVS